MSVSPTEIVNHIMSPSPPLEALSTKTPPPEKAAPRPIKRPRVAVACSRCKTRKQKCNGAHPCANCRDFGAVCEYLPPKSMNRNAGEQQKSAQAVQAVEDRVAELESLLRREGIVHNGSTMATSSSSSSSASTGQKRRHRASQSSITTYGSAPASPVDSVYPSSKRWKPSPVPSGSASDSQRSGSDASTPHVGGLPKRMAVSTVVEILRDLSIEASGGYIGASSQITMGRMISSIVQAKEYNVSGGSNNHSKSGAGGSGGGGGGSISGGSWEHLSPKSANTAPALSDCTTELGQIPNEIADKLFAGYLLHISTRWPVLQTPFMRLLHTERETLTDAFFTSILHLIYAIAGRFLETTGETGDFFPEQHYDQALKNMDDILRLHDVRSVQFLLLLSIYSLRSPRGPGAWTYSGLAMRQCIEMGMHRKAPPHAHSNSNNHRSRSILEHEMRKRVFWTNYCLDRQVSMILGRPFAISDRDIDVELPLDVDEACEDIPTLERLRAEALARAAESQAAGTRPPPTEKSTSMTGFIYITRLRIIESNIQQSVYRVDEGSPSATEAEVERFLAQLEDWRASMPVDASAPRPDLMIVDGHDNYMCYYYKCLRSLLHPVILSQESGSKYLKKCAEVCGGVCRTYKKLHQAVPVGFSVMALHSIFLAGLTLIYCAWASPKQVFSIATSNDMNACSIVLYIITERWPGARKYRDIYEAVKGMVLDSIEEGEYEPRRAVANLRPGLAAALQGIGTAPGEGDGEVSAMVSDMAGGPLLGAGSGGDVGLGGDEGGNGMEDNGTIHIPSCASMVNTPGGTGGGSLGFMLPLDGMPLDFHEADAYNAMDLQMGTIFATPETEWMVAG